MNIYNKLIKSNVTDEPISETELPLPDASISETELPLPDASISETELPLPDASISETELPLPDASISETELPLPDASISETELPLPDEPISETESSINVIITESLNSTVETYDDSSTTSSILAEIQHCANKIKGSKFQGNGTIEDYNSLFVSTSNILSGTQQMKLEVDVSGFERFGTAADELSSLFTSFITKLENVNIIDDTVFLNSILRALQKVVHLTEVFGKFKETIIATSKIEIPESCRTTSTVLQNVITEIDSAVEYINYFVNPEINNIPDGAEISNDQQNAIITACNTIDSWNHLCSQGVSIAMTNDVDIQNINTINSSLSSSSNSLINATSILKSKLKNNYQEPPCPPSE